MHTSEELSQQVSTKISDTKNRSLRVCIYAESMAGMLYTQAFVWKHEKLQKVISHVLEQRLTGLTYDPVKSAQVLM